MFFPKMKDSFSHHEGLSFNGESAMKVGALVWVNGHDEAARPGTVVNKTVVVTRHGVPTLYRIRFDDTELEEFVDVHRSDLFYRQTELVTGSKGLAT